MGKLVEESQRRLYCSWRRCRRDGVADGGEIEEIVLKERRRRLCSSWTRSKRDDVHGEGEVEEMVKQMEENCVAAGEGAEEMAWQVK